MADAALRRVTDPRSPAPAASQAAARPAATVRALNCPNCGGAIALRAAGVTTTLVCEHCGTTLDATRPDVRVIAAASDAMRVPIIALGTRGTLDGTQWEVIGYLERSDDEVDWSEYLLFNPYEGYAFLVDDGRRFSIGRLLDRSPGWGGGAVSVAGQSFEPFGTPYPVHVTFVVGEFYWRVAVGERVTATDYVMSGTMLSCEENESERTWTLLTLLDLGVAEHAFGIEERRERASDTPAPHEPSPYLRPLREALTIGGLAIAALFVIATGLSGSRTLFRTEVDVPLDGTTRTAVLGPLTLPAARQKVSVEANGRALDNMWVDLDYSLVERRSQASYDSYSTAERYHGQDSDGDWSEGTGDPAVGLASIPGGTYDLVVELSAHNWIDPKAQTSTSWFGQPVATPAGPTATPVDIVVTRGGFFGGLLWLAILVIAVRPVCLWFRHSAFETRRKAVLGGGDDD